MNIPVLCGECHQEGTEVSERLDIAQDRILENYSLSIHGVHQSPELRCRSRQNRDLLVPDRSHFGYVQRIVQIIGSDLNHPVFRPIGNYEF